MGNEQVIDNIDRLVPEQPPPPQQTHKTTKRMRSKRPMLFSKVKMTSKITKKKEDGVKMVNDYVMVDTIGQGLFGKVKKVTRLQNGVEKVYAMKILKKHLMAKQKVYYKDEQGVLKTKDGTELMDREIAVYKKIRHKNLIRMYEVLRSQSEEQDKVYLVLELAEKGQLIDWDEDDEVWKFTDENRTEKVSEKELRQIVRGCIKGLYHRKIHENSIIHRDIKPQNILFSADGTTKLSDFGISQMKTELKMNELKGTDFFLAPECFQRQRDKILDGKALDIWALGVTIYCFYYLKLPFEGDDLELLIEDILNKKVVYQPPISKQLQQLMEKLLDKDAGTRITMHDLIHCEWVNVDCPSLSSELKSEVVQISEDDMRGSINYNVRKSTTQTKKPLRQPESHLSPNYGLSEQVEKPPNSTKKIEEEEEFGVDVSIRIDVPPVEEVKKPTQQTPGPPNFAPQKEQSGQVKTIRLSLMKDNESDLEIIPIKTVIQMPWTVNYTPDYDKFCEFHAKRLYK